MVVWLKPKVYTLCITPFIAAHGRLSFTSWHVRWRAHFCGLWAGPTHQRSFVGQVYYYYYCIFVIAMHLLEKKMARACWQHTDGYIWEMKMCNNELILLLIFVYMFIWTVIVESQRLLWFWCFTALPHSHCLVDKVLWSNKRTGESILENAKHKICIVSDIIVARLHSTDAWQK